MVFYNFSSSFKIVGNSYKTLNLNISAFRQNIKKLISNFGVILVRIMHAKFHLSLFNGVEGELGDRRTQDITPDPYTKSLNSSLTCFACLGGITPNHLGNQLNPSL